MSILNNSYSLKLFDEELILLPQKAVYLKNHKTLLAADLHIGKTAHFRNAGIPVPSELAFVDLELLSNILDNSQLEIERFIVLGDLFHAEINIDWRILKDWRDRHRGIQFQLVKGNHDILTQMYYDELGIETFDIATFHKFLLVHKYNSSENVDGLYKICGHVHPAVRLVGRARQKITLPCFYFGETVGILPAFGRFTGRYLLNPKDQDKVFVLAETIEGRKVIHI